MKIEPRIGYGNLTNLIVFEQVYMITHKEGQGVETDPMRQIRTFFSKDGDFLGRIDPIKSYPSNEHGN